MTDDLPHLNEELSLVQRLHSETALISWHELQRFFAQGVVLHVSEALNLVETAVLLAEDQVDKISELLDIGTVSHPSNDQARAWYEADATLWSVVVAPYILVQEQKPNTAH